MADGTPGSNLNWKASKGLTGSEDIFLKYPSLAIMEAVDNFVEVNQIILQNLTVRNRSTLDLNKGELFSM